MQGCIVKERYTLLADISERFRHKSTILTFFSVWKTVTD